MPLKAGKSKKTISSNIREMYTHPGQHFKKRIAKVGKKQAQREMIAAAERKAHEGSKPARKRRSKRSK